MNIDAVVFVTKLAVRMDSALEADEQPEARLFLNVGDASKLCCILISRNEDSQRLSKSFRNFILPQVNSNRYMNHMSRSIRMNGQPENPSLYNMQSYIP